MKMVDTHFKSEQNLFLHLDTEKILSAPLYILLESVTLSQPVLFIFGFFNKGFRNKSDFFLSHLCCKYTDLHQEGFIEAMTRFSQCLNAKTVFFNF